MTDPDDRPSQPPPERDPWGDDDNRLVWRDKDLARASRRRTVRITLAIAVGLAAGLALEFALMSAEQQRTAMFYVVVPGTIALIVIALLPPKTSTGWTMVAITIGLVLAGPLLREGMICLWIASPLFYGLVGLVAWVDRQDRGRRALAILPILLIAGLEGIGPIPTAARDNQATAIRTLDVSPLVVEQLLAGTPRFRSPESWFLNLGFPKPVEATGSGLGLGDSRHVVFNPRISLGLFATPEPRSMTMVVSRRDPQRVVFRITQDTAMARWLDFQSAEVTWHALPGNKTRVTWTLNYRRTFDPSWYFGPIQQYGMSEAAGYLADNVTRP